LILDVIQGLKSKQSVCNSNSNAFKSYASLAQMTQSHLLQDSEAQFENLSLQGPQCHIDDFMSS